MAIYKAIGTSTFDNTFDSTFQGTGHPIGADGGSVFQKSGTSFAIRKRAKPIMKRTALTTAVRNKFESVSGIWRTLSDPGQDSFIDEAPNYPRFNSQFESYELTGNNLQNSSNLRLINAGVPPITDIPGVQMITPPAGFGMYVDTTVPEIGFTMTSPIVPADEIWVAMLINARLPGNDFVQRDSYHFVRAFTAGQDASANLYAEFSALFGINLFIPGNFCFGRMNFIAATTGQLMFNNTVSIGPIN